MVVWGALLFQEGDEGRESMENLRAGLGGCRVSTLIHFYMSFFAFAVFFCLTRLWMFLV